MSGTVTEIPADSSDDDDPPIEAIQQAASILLQEVFGYDSFRGPQEKVIERVVTDKDALVLMPTGGGQIPMLPDPCIDPRGADRRRHSNDFADAGSGGRPDPIRQVHAQTSKYVSRH